MNKRYDPNIQTNQENLQNVYTQPQKLTSQTKFSSNIKQDKTQQTSATFNYSFRKSAHPIACFATFLFKVLALIFYLVIGYFMSNVMTFICVLLLSSFDFWIVKNITGRLLVGLRWWNQVDQQSNSIWKFESHKQDKTNSADRMFFWTTQFTNTIIWIFILLINLITLSFFWAFLNLINFSLSLVNLYGFYRCRKDYNKKIELLKNEKIGQIATKIFFY